MLIFQDDLLISATLTVLVIPFTTNLAMRKLPTCVFVSADEFGLRQDSIAICHQMRALDKRGLIEHWGILSAELMAEIERTVLRTLGIRVRASQ